MPEPLKIIFCYAPRDKPLLMKLKNHLRPLQEQKLIDFWYDCDISSYANSKVDVTPAVNRLKLIDVFPLFKRQPDISTPLPRRQPGVLAPYVFGEDIPWGWLEHRSGRFLGQKLALNRSVISIGREEDNDIWLDDEVASRYHAELVWDSGQVYITDCNSLNGVLLNGRRTRGTLVVNNGDLIEIGSQRFIFEVAERPISLADQDDPLMAQMRHQFISPKTDFPDNVGKLTNDTQQQTIRSGGMKQQFFDAAQIVLLLVSQAFMDSDYCYSFELRQALERHAKGEVKVIPIILEYTNWRVEPLSKLETLPSNAKPIMSDAWHNQNEAFDNVVEGIRKVIDELMQKQMFTDDLYQPSKSSDSDLKHQPSQPIVDEIKLQSPRPLRVFLCHSYGDKPIVRELYKRLKKVEGIAPWLDEEDLLPGQDWQKEIRNAVRMCDIVIICLSIGSITKVGYVQKEIKFALDVADEQPEGVIFLIPLKLEECRIPDRLIQLHWVNYFEEGGFDKLMKALAYRAKSLD